VTEQRSPLEQALDLVLYAPVGLAVVAQEQLPRLIDKGRQRVTGQLTIARMIGQFVVAQGQREVTKVAKQANDALSARRAGPVAATAAVAHVAAATAPPAAPAINGNAAPASASGQPPTSEGLAIPGYDSLSASQVVQRLAGLASGELEAVRGYETLTRGRRTILNRIAQLQAGVR
jgi:hypothetical protein